MNQARILHGDCKDVLSSIDSDSVQLIVTSPPYAEARKHTYGGVPTDEYVEWFLPISKELMRVLKPTGTFILNIKEGAANCERQTYVLELILALREQGWLWTEEFIWHKKNAMPGKWRNRFRDSWERLLQFNKQKYFDMYQEEVFTPIGIWSKNDVRADDPRYMQREEKGTGSGFGVKRNSWVGRDMVAPGNVLHIPVVGYNTGHSAVFPKSVPRWFIKLFSKGDDIILDPFAGSGTTLFVAREEGRNAVGIEIHREYVEMIEEKIIDSYQPVLI